MNEERLQVLQMVASGTITPEQGEELMEALTSSAEQPDPMPRREYSSPGRATTRADRNLMTRLSDARMLGVTPEYIRQLAELGYPNLALEKYVELRSLGLNPEYIAEMRASGYADLSLDDLVHMRASGINPEYIAEMVALGFGGDAAERVQEETETATDHTEDEER